VKKNNSKNGRANRNTFQSITLMLFLFGILFLFLPASVLHSQANKDSLNITSRDTARINPLRNNHVDLTGQNLTDASFPNSWPIFGTRTRMAIGGYVKVDYLQDFSGTLNDRFQFTIHNVPVKGTDGYGQQGYMNFFVRESRFNFDIRSQTEKGTPVRIFIEMDFWNLDRSPFFNTPRLRHAYGVLGQFLVGRTWGTLTDVYSIPTTIDFGAGDAISGSRRPQVRWEKPLSEMTNWAVALEMLEFPDIDNVADQDGQPSQLLPLFAGRITHELNSGGRIMLGGSVGQLRWDGLGTGPNATCFGWGVLFSGRHNLGELNYFYWNFSGGDGWGSNIISQIGLGNSAVLTPDGSLEPIFSYNISGGFAYYLSPILATNISTAWQSLEDSEFKSDESLKQGGTVHANLIWSPARVVNLGVEYMVGYRKNKNGADGTAHRAQAMIKFIF